MTDAKKFGMNKRTLKIEEAFRIRDGGQYGEWSWCNLNREVLDFPRNTPAECKAAALLWYSKEQLRAQETVGFLSTVTDLICERNRTIV